MPEDAANDIERQEQRHNFDVMAFRDLHGEEDSKYPIRRLNPSLVWIWKIDDHFLLKAMISQVPCIFYLVQ